MAIEFKTIPVLHGEAAARFVEAADEALEKRGGILNNENTPRILFII